MQTKIVIIKLTLVVMLFGCSTSGKLPAGKSSRKAHFSLQAGINKGGITENTDMSLIDGAQPDAFTGATKTGFNIGARTTHPVWEHSLTTGVDFMYNRQSFNWNDAARNYYGSRILDVSQIMVPLTWNFHLLRSKQGEALMQLSAGANIQYNIVNVAESSGTHLPEYSILPISGGPVLGLSVFPVKTASGNRIGIYVDGYRGTRIYEDEYNQPGFEIPGSSFLKFGIIYRFNHQ